ncbi:hypothetical protein G9A89_020252 [Geosiphon pyriformis]|nr:hypothetical protein G9A89_020252 [Geosiphon pyriformis]
MPAGKLSVLLLEAKNLKDKDVIGKSDPYVELYFDKRYKQRSTTKQDTLEPYWEEDFKFHVEKEHTLHIQVYDEDHGRLDDELGDVKIDLKHVFSTGYVDTWVKLPEWIGLRSQGELHLILEFIDRN